MNMRAFVIQNESKFLRLTFNVIHETSFVIFSLLGIYKLTNIRRSSILIVSYSRICAFVFSEENSHLE